MQDEFAELQNPPPDTCQHLKGKTISAQFTVGPTSGVRVVPYCRKYNADLSLRAEDLGVEVSSLTEQCSRGEEHCPLSHA